MRTKFRLPEDPLQRAALWQKMLSEVDGELSNVAILKMQIAQDMAALQIRAMKGEELGTEISACHKRELQARMAELALGQQKEELSRAISGQ